MLAELRRASSNSVAISFEATALEAVRARSDYPIGLAIGAWDAADRRAAARLTPEYLFIRSDRIPARNRPLWPGDWHWVVYVVDEPDEACALLKRGADLIETDRIGEMIAALGQDCADA
ncbi:MAG: hypothetical protein RQ741_05330 [Wenzhouxiangellaceae bacterium]|nr:hypothetical protein [Wenzhouxiangellaceae bacterium]